MKPKDLRLGHYLSLDGLPYRVAQITTPSVAGDLYDGFILENGVEDEGTDIPLTPKILDAIGWYRGPFGTMYVVSNKPERRATWNIESHNLVITRDDSTYERRKRHTMLSLFVDNVRQLQDALRICGMDDTMELRPKDIRE